MMNKKTGITFRISRTPLNLADMTAVQNELAKSKTKPFTAGFSKSSVRKIKL